MLLQVFRHNGGQFWGYSLWLPWQTLPWQPDLTPWSTVVKELLGFYGFCGEVVWLLLVTPVVDLALIPEVYCQQWPEMSSLDISLHDAHPGSLQDMLWSRLRLSQPVANSWAGGESEWDSGWFVSPIPTIVCLLFSRSSIPRTPPDRPPPPPSVGLLLSLSPKWSGDEGYSLWPCVVTLFL